MSNSYRAGCEDATTVETIGMRLSVNIPEDVPTTSRYLSSISLRIDNDVVVTLEAAFNRLIRFVNIPDSEIVGNLLSRFAVLHTLPMLLQRAHEFMESIGLHRGDDFQFGVSEWIDDEVEGWNYLQFKVTLLGPGMDKLLEKGMDKFALLKNLITMAGQMLPQEVRQEVIVLLE